MSVDLTTRNNPVRVELRSTSDPFTMLDAGDQGTATRIDQAGMLHVSWDSGSSLGLDVRLDSWDWLNLTAIEADAYDRLIAFLTYGEPDKSHRPATAELTELDI